MTFRPLLNSLSLTVLACLPLAIVTAQTPEQKVTSLEPDKPAIERELAGSQNHSYQITLIAGQYLHVVVRQRGIDVAITLTGPDGKTLLEVDSPIGDKGPESLRWIAESSGLYGLAVSAPDKNAAVGRYDMHIVELRTATDQDRELIESGKLFKESESLVSRNRFVEAIPPAERSLAIREKILGEDSLEVAEAANNLAEIHANTNGYAKAEALYQRELAIQEKILGREHLAVANTLSNLGILHTNFNNLDKPEPLLQRALEIRRKLLGDEHPDVAQAFSNLARLNLGKGNYDQAEQFYGRALAIWEKNLKPDDPKIAASLNMLALIYNNKGNYAKAEPLFQRALEIREKAFGLEDTRVASVLNNLALLRFNQSDYDRTEQLLKRALSIYEKAYSPEHTDVATALNNLADLYDAKSDYDKAESFFKRALAIREKRAGAESLAVANTLANFAAMYKRKGDYDKAESYFQRSLAITEKLLGSEHPVVATSLADLAILYAAMKQSERAVITQRRAAEISEFNLNLNIATGSERQKLAYLGTFSGQTNWIVSLHVNAAPNDSAARDLALATILRRKGRALDSMTDNIAALRRRASPQDQTLLDKLQSANTQLAQVTLGGVQKLTPVEHQARIKSLVEQVEKLEAEISTHLTEFRVQSQPVTIAAVQSALPEQSALIEFFTYRPFDVRARREKQLGAPAYVAYVLNRAGEAKWANLGEAKAIDEAIDKLRQSLRNRNSQDFKSLAREVDRLVMQPLYPLLGGARQIFLSPDSSLNLIPFAALVDQNNRYLVERYSFTYLTSGRDLLRLQIAGQNKGDALIVADPVFGEKAASKERLPLSQQLSQTTDSALDFSRISLSPLPGTAEEARAIKQILPNATVLTRERATETALKQTHSPTILHIATHSFFLPDLAPGTEITRGVSLGSALAVQTLQQRIENPLLRSGLVLTGVQQPKSDGDDGILTAMEAASLDLCWTKLVVLSACNTGVGEVRNGDGVYGLRRALVLAGAESLLMSLWPVSDKGTRDLMIAYYGELGRGKERGEALRQVQLRMLQSQTRRHPFYWASFIQSGEWKSLN